MIAFNEALELVLSHACIPEETEPVNLEHAVGRVLAQDVISDVDMPPFDKSAMDGYAIRISDLHHTLQIMETVPAGVVPSKEVGPGQCIKVMTGSMIPRGADSVIKVEDTVQVDEDHIRFNREKTHHNICFKGEDVTRGQKVMDAGTLLEPQHIAMLASTGVAQPLVYPNLRIGIMTTGDELVEPHKIPAPAQIRNSNAWQLQAQTAKMGMEVTYYGIIHDQMSSLTRAIETASAQNDLVLLTGGVSMGDYDLVPEALQKAGFEIIFKKIAVQPGSPTLFARRGPVSCFGLPGNPVSSFVQFEMLVKPFVYNSMGHRYQPKIVRLPMGSRLNRKSAERLALVPVRVTDGQVFPVEYHGSAHIHAYADALGILTVLPGITVLEEKTLVDVRFI